MKAKSKAIEDLNEVAIKQLIWKPGPMRTAAVQIVNAAMDSGIVWPDQIDFSGVEEQDKNCIGTAFRLLMKESIIMRTDRFRRSESGASKGRTIFGYRLLDPLKAATFLARHKSESAVKLKQQMEFRLTN